MKRRKKRSAERLEVRNLLAADLGVDDDLLPPPDKQLDPPPLIDQMD